MAHPLCIHSTSGLNHKQEIGHTCEHHFYYLHAGQGQVMYHVSQCKMRAGWDVRYQLSSMINSNMYIQYTHYSCERFATLRSPMKFAQPTHCMRKLWRSLDWFMRFNRSDNRSDHFTTRPTCNTVYVNSLNIYWHEKSPKQKLERRTKCISWAQHTYSVSFMVFDITKQIRHYVYISEFLYNNHHLTITSQT
jgi:hypothetical protein